MNEMMTIVRFKYYFDDTVNGETDPIEKQLVNICITLETRHNFGL